MLVPNPDDDSLETRLMKHWLGAVALQMRCSSSIADCIFTRRPLSLEEERWVRELDDVQRDMWSWVSDDDTESETQREMLHLDGGNDLT